MSDRSEPSFAVNDALRLAEPLRAELLRRATAAYPREACGLLIGRRSGEAAEVAQLRRARNMAPEGVHDRFELDPRDQLAAEDEARARGLEIVGVWHSHPDRPAQPSEEDRAQAWSGWSYLIVSVTHDGACELRSWRLRGERFVEEGVQP